MIRNAYLAPLLGAALAATPAFAVQITNRDAVERTVTISEKDASQDVALKPSETRDGLCGGGCNMRIKGGEEYVFGGSERLSIEENIIFVDDAPAPPPVETKK